LLEQETVIRWNRAEKTVHIYTCDPAVARRCERLAFELVRVEEWPDGAVSGRFYRASTSTFRWGRKRTQKGGFLPRKPRVEAVSGPLPAGTQGEV
jgi:hypothetical protein